jgi:predicted deacylase
MDDARIRRIDGLQPREVPPTVEAFLRALGGPSWIRIAGRDRSRARVVATLLHGNEPSGVRAVHAWCREGARPAVDTVLFVASVAAALEAPGFAYRVRPGGRDLNRSFAPEAPGEEGRLAREALELLRDCRPEALVDLHNTTGHTPPYGVGPTRGPTELAIVSMFADRWSRPPAPTSPA